MYVAHHNGELMSRIDDVITAIPAMTETKRATWAVNAARVIAFRP